MPVPCVFLSFFSRYRDHRHLHSFPTRRSSDLDHRGRSGDVAFGQRGPFRPGRRRRRSDRAGGGRSEEHTSELQSLTNLVCRLLLEKKKYTVLTQATWVLQQQTARQNTSAAAHT